MIDRERITRVKNKIFKIEASLEYHKKQTNLLKLSFENLNQNLSLYKEASILASKAVNLTHSQLKINIEPIINTTLSYIFDEPITAELQFGERGKDQKKSQAYFVIKQNEILMEKDISNRESGGIIETVALGIRIGFLLLKRDLAKILILDEPFSRLKGESSGELKYQVQAFNILNKLSKEFDIQVIVVPPDRDGVSLENAYKIEM